MLQIPLGNPRLAKDAYPTKFPGCPKYLTQSLPKKRRAIQRTSSKHVSKKQKFSDENTVSLNFDDKNSITNNGKF